MQLLAPEKALKLQSLFACLILVAWPAFLVVLPAAWAHHWMLGLGAAVFPGLFLWTWVAVLMHETWHSYLPGINNDLAYALLTWVMVGDPQVYKLVHADHHVAIHTYEDVEFYPLGEIRHPAKRKLFVLLQYTFGVLFTGAVLFRLTRIDPRYRPRFRLSSRLASHFIGIGIYVVLGSLSHGLLGAPATTVVVSYLVMLWLGSVFIHHDQLLPHIGIIAEGTWEERNLPMRGLAAYVFHFLTHGDTREHLLHHTMTEVNSRPIPTVHPMPPEAPYISLGEYLRCLWRYWKEPPRVVRLGSPEGSEGARVN